jgi:hypothetical protein
MSDPDVINNGHTIGHFIKDYWPMILAFVGFIISILVILKGKIPLIEKRMDDAHHKLKKIEDSNYIERNMLFDSNNQFRFQSVPMCVEIREECQMHQKIFQDRFCKQLDTLGKDLKITVNDMDRKREETRSEITTMNKKLIELMTQMKTILARDRKEETAEMVQLVVRQVITQMKNQDIISL